MNLIRFTVMDGDNQVHQTDWHPENTKDDALRVMTDVRKSLGGNYRYQIERTGDIKTPNTVPQFRYKIVSRNGQIGVKTLEGTDTAVSTAGATLFSKVFQEPEREQVLAEIRALFPDAVLTEEKF